MPRSSPRSLEPAKPIYAPLTDPRQERLAQLIATGHPRKEAYAIAGFKGKTASAVTQRCNSHDIRGRVRGVLEKSEQAAVASIAVSKNEIVESLRETRALAKKGTPVLAKDGSETGIYKPDLSAKNKADDILAGMHGFKIDVQREESLDDLIDGMDADAAHEFVMGLVESLDPNIKKQVIAGLAKAAEAGEGDDLSDDRTLQ